MAKYFLTLALMACLALGAAAQDENEGWGTLTLEWNPMTYHYTGKIAHNDYYYYDDDYDYNMNGFSIGYTRAFPLTQSVPLFLEPGLLAQFTYWSDTESGNSWEETKKIMVASLKAPVNLLYKFTFPNSSIALMPFAGITVRGNLWGEYKEDWVEDHESGSSSVNIFDKKKMGKDDVFKRVQVGWQIGVKARFGEKFIVGGSYGTDFNEISKKYKMHTGTLMVGLVL